MKNTRGSEWNKWDLHIHTASSYDSPYKADDADELLCQDQEIKQNVVDILEGTMPAFDLRRRKYV